MKTRYFICIVSVLLLRGRPLTGWAQESPSMNERVTILTGMEASMPHARFLWNSFLGIPRQVERISSEQLSLAPDSIKAYFVRNFSSLYGIEHPETDVLVGALTSNRDGSRKLSLFQKYEGVLVYGVSLNLGIDQDRRLQSISGKWLPDVRVDVRPKLSRDDAVEQVAEYLRSRYTGPAPLPGRIDLKADEVELTLFNSGLYTDSRSPSYLAYRVEIRSAIFFVDAHSGEVIYSYSNVQLLRNRKTYNSYSCYALPGTLIIDESGPLKAPDSMTISAHEFAGVVQDYYQNTHGRNSYDDRGSPIISTVHSGLPQNIILLLLCCIFGLDCCGCDQANAAWIPSLDQVVYGDGGSIGGGKSYKPFAEGLDVVAHEITHAVTQHSIFDGLGTPVGMDYTGQSGALCESYSDFFAAMIDRDDWLIGEDIAVGFPSGALRNMADPPSSGGPDYMAQYDTSGDVHFNCGIPDKVGYLIAQGGTHPFSHIFVEGIGRAAAEKIYYRAVTHYLTQTATFLDARAATLLSCEELFPGDRVKYAAVWNAYAACGVCDQMIPGSCEPLRPPTAVEDRLQPGMTSLEQNYPNPFNPTTIIRFRISQHEPVSLKVYDMLGRELPTLVDQVMRPGEYEVTWDARGTSSGVYYYRLTAGKFVGTRKMLMMK